MTVSCFTVARNILVIIKNSSLLMDCVFNTVFINVWPICVLVNNIYISHHCTDWNNSVSIFINVLRWTSLVLHLLWLWWKFLMYHLPILHVCWAFTFPNILPRHLLLCFSNKLLLFGLNLWFRFLFGFNYSFIQIKIWNWWSILIKSIWFGIEYFTMLIDTKITIIHHVSRTSRLIHIRCHILWLLIHRVYIKRICIILVLLLHLLIS